MGNKKQPKKQQKQPTANSQLLPAWTSRLFAKEKGHQGMIPSGLCHRVWWSWGDLNPRPQAFFVQFYMCSRLI